MKGVIGFVVTGQCWICLSLLWKSVKISWFFELSSRKIWIFLGTTFNELSFFIHQLVRASLWH